MRRSKNQGLCKKYMNKYVRIQTAHGIYEGKIVKVSNNKVYLQSASQYNRDKAQISFFPAILPLVLFDLLVIVLLDRPFRPFYPCRPPCF